MSHKATQRGAAPIALVFFNLAFAPVLLPQTEWRRVGNTGIDLGLASVAGGPVARVWFSPDGNSVYARTPAGKIFVTNDFEQWRPSAESEPPPRGANIRVARLPEPAIATRARSPRETRVYAFGRFVYRSEDAGSSWTNVTAHRNQSLIGDGLADLAVSPADPDEILVAGATGLWRSVDQGMSWTGVGQKLPALPVERLLATPGEGRGVQVALTMLQGIPQPVEWMPGEKSAWRPVSDGNLAAEMNGRLALSANFGAAITALRTAGDWIYAGSVEGRLWVSSDSGRSWRTFGLPAGPVSRIWVDAGDPRLALAVVARQGTGPRVLRTQNGGQFWDDLSANLPEQAAVNGVVADRSTGAIYIATSLGVFSTLADLLRAAPATPWTRLEGLPPGSAAKDVLLDPNGYQLYVAMEGEGVYAGMAPHRERAPKALSAADYSERAAAPGSLLSVVGMRIRQAQANGFPVPVLSADAGESQLQVPFEAQGSTLSLALDGARFGLPLRETSPAIFVDRDGAPMVLDADSGLVLDGAKPARSNSRIQILCTGLGRVRPEWPTGIAAPLENPPVVVSDVKVYVDRVPVDVTRAVLAPGYIGFYLVEVELPKLVNYGPAELYVETGGQASNRVRVYIEP
ncbi:MAG: hypothetical protein K2X35_03910 [Bryobacteraceae bacterium]|nr:hypothetical protein [Bryobacteraceae bacterium]